MQPAYLDRLGPAVRDFVEAVEGAAGLAIVVLQSAGLNTGGPTGQGNLEIEIEAQRVRLYAPTNGYFPDGAVRHEVLHVHRLHVDKVPRLTLAEDVEWNPAFEQGLVQIDNALEHLAIVPVELQHHPERVEHWEAVLAKMWQVEIEQATPDDRRIASGLHWAFMRHVMPDSPTCNIAIAEMDAYGLRAEADAVAGRLLSQLGDKAALVRTFFDCFPEVPRHQAALAYLDSMTGTTCRPIPA